MILFFLVEIITLAGNVNGRPLERRSKLYYRYYLLRHLALERQTREHGVDAVDDRDCRISLPSRFQRRVIRLAHSIKRLVDDGPFHLRFLAHFLERRSTQRRLGGSLLAPKQGRQFLERLVAPRCKRRVVIVHDGIIQAPNVFIHDADNVTHVANTRVCGDVEHDTAVEQFIHGILVEVAKCV